MTTGTVDSAPDSTDRDAPPGRSSAGSALRRRLWTGLTGAVGAVAGITPHVLHHVGPLVGTALVAGAGGTVLFGVLGLLLSVPMLLRLRRRFRSWWAPGIALVVFAAGFAVSTFVIGPRISGLDEAPAPVPSVDEHAAHHD